MNEFLESNEQSVEGDIKAKESIAQPPFQTINTTSSITPQAGVNNCGCSSEVDSNSNINKMPPSFIYAIGRIDARFPNIATEKEFAQVVSRAETAGKTNQQIFHSALSKRENRYLARQLCWVLSVQGLDTYLLIPRDPADLDLLIEAIRPAQDANDIDVVIGMRGPIAPPEMCNGLMIPIVIFDQIYSFDKDSFIKAIPVSKKTTSTQLTPAADELFKRILQLTDNAGAIDEHRALNYLAMRYSGIYEKVAEQNGNDSSLTGVDVLPSSLSGTRKILKAIFSYTHRKTGFTEKCFVRVDVTEEFPFLVTGLAQYFDR